MLFEREGTQPMGLTSLLPEAYGTLSTVATVGGTYLLWRFNPRRMRKLRSVDDAAVAAEVQAEHDRRVAAETHAALWGTPELVDDTGAMIRRAQPGMLAEVQALRNEFPRNGKSARALMEEISQRQILHQKELHEHARAADIVHNALWVALLDGNDTRPQQGPPAAPVRDEVL